MDPGPAPAPEARAQLEPGSFRDRDARVFYAGGAVWRALSERGLAEWERLASTRFFARALAEHKVVATARRDPPAAAAIPAPSSGERWSAFLEHQLVPFVSYPYEWTFGMLKDAALLQLELVGAALEEDMILKDSTPYNVQWEGAAPVFIDVASFVKLAPGEPWVGYRQFCELFLYPLFLQAYKGASFRPWLRGRIDGIPAEDARGLFSFRDLFRSGVFAHVVLQAALQRRTAGSERNVREDLKRAGFHKELIQINVRKLAKLVRGLEWRAERSTWSEYAESAGYDDDERKRKADFVRAAVAREAPALVWDLGANTGEYSRIAAEGGRTVIAMDSDALAVERMYQALKREGRRDVLPLVVDVCDASPNLGWRGSERKELGARGRPDLVLCLALVHHVVIGGNVPLPEFVDWLAGLGRSFVLEFVSRDDPRTQQLLRHKDQIYDDYDVAVLERALHAANCEVLARETLRGGARVLFHARRRR